MDSSPTVLGLAYFTAIEVERISDSTGQGLVSSGIAGDGKLGVVEKANRTQKVALTDVVSTNLTDFDTLGSNSNFKFDNLIVGKRYRLEFNAQGYAASSGNRTSILFNNDDSGTEETALSRIYFSSGSVDTETRYVSQEWVATTSQIRVRQSYSNTYSFAGGGTWMRLTEQ